MDRIRKGSFTPQAREHEVDEAKPGSAGRLTGFIDFAFGDQRLAVGSRPASRRWRIGINNVLFAGPVTAGRTVPGSPSRPSSGTFLTDRMTDIATALLHILDVEI